MSRRVLRSAGGAIVVELNDALLDRPVKALEPIGSAGNLCLQGLPTLFYCLILGALTLN